MSLTEDEFDVAAREEEGDKGHGTGSSIGFDYNNPPAASTSSAPKRVQPTLRQLANCIEKTSEFIVSQGSLPNRGNGLAIYNNFFDRCPDGNPDAG